MEKSERTNEVKSSEENQTMQQQASRHQAIQFMQVYNNVDPNNNVCMYLCFTELWNYTHSDRAKEKQEKPSLLLDQIVFLRRFGCIGRLCECVLVMCFCQCPFLPNAQSKPILFIQFYFVCRSSSHTHVIPVICAHLKMRSFSYLNEEKICTKRI